MVYSYYHHFSGNEIESQKGQIIWAKWSESESHSVMSDSLRPHGLNSPGQNTGVGSLFLLQGIFPTQGSNPGLRHYRQILYQLSHKGSPIWAKSHRNTRPEIYAHSLLHELCWCVFFFGPICANFKIKQEYRENKSLIIGKNLYLPKCIHHK